MDPRPQAPKPVEKVPRTERVTQALERVRELAKRVTGKVIGYKVDTYNSRGYGAVQFYLADEAKAVAAVAESREGRSVHMIYDDMVYGDSHAAPDGEDGIQYFGDVQTATFHRVPAYSNGKHTPTEMYTVLGAKATKEEFDDFIGAVHSTIVDTLKAEKPGMRYHGGPKTYGEINRD